MGTFDKLLWKVVKNCNVLEVNDGQKHYIRYKDEIYSINGEFFDNPDNGIRWKATSDEEEIFAAFAEFDKKQSLDLQVQSFAFRVRMSSSAICSLTDENEEKELIWKLWKSAKQV